MFAFGKQCCASHKRCGLTPNDVALRANTMLRIDLLPLLCYIKLEVGDIMKKFKEILWFIIPFLSLSAITIIYFVLNVGNGANYLKFMISDPIFIIALVNTFIPPVILSFALVLVYKLVLRFVFKKTVKGRKLNFIILYMVSVIAPIVYIVIMKKGAFDLINNTIFTLQSGIIVTFIFWVVDVIKEKAKSKKL